jgi:hypothetical protein
MLRPGVPRAQCKAKRMTAPNAAALLVTVSLQIHERDSAGMGRESGWSTLGDLSIRITHQRRAIPDALASAIALGWIERVADLYATTPAGRAVVAAEQRKPRAVAGPAPVPIPSQAAKASAVQRAAIRAAQSDTGRVLLLMGDGRERTTSDVQTRFPNMLKVLPILRALHLDGQIDRTAIPKKDKAFVYTITPAGREEIEMLNTKEITT